MVEASVTFPLAILSLVAVVYVLIFLTRQVMLQSDMHMALREEAGSQIGITETYYRNEIPFTITESRKGYIREYQYDGVVRFSKRGLLTKDYVRNLRGSLYAEREIDFVRRMDLTAE